MLGKIVNKQQVIEIANANNVQLVTEDDVKATGIE